MLVTLLESVDLFLNKLCEIISQHRILLINSLLLDGACEQVVIDSNQYKEKIIP